MSKLKVASVAICAVAVSAAVWWLYPDFIPEDPFAVDGPPIAVDRLTVAERLQFDANTSGVTAENNQVDPGHGR